MIAGIFHEGSGLGNQLARYVMTRVLATDKGYEWGMINASRFKGGEFMKLNMGTSLVNSSREDYEIIQAYYDGAKVFLEKKVIENGVDIRSYDPEINFVEDNTIIDGEFQDERYFKHRLPEIAEWLKVEPLVVPDDTCVIGFRGGEYALFPELFLGTEYYEKAIIEMHKINPQMHFEVHTDDPNMAELMLTPIFGTNPKKITYVDNTQISHSKHTNMGLNWRAMRYATHAIIANSSFYILPRLLAHQDQDAVTIAPRWWARRYAKVWAQPQNYYKDFLYV